MNEAIAFAFGVAMGAGAVFVSMRVATTSLRDAVAMLSSALHPAAPLPPPVERAPIAEPSETPSLAEARAERVRSIRAKLATMAMRSGTPVTDEELDEEAERLAGTDVHGSP